MSRCNFLELTVLLLLATTYGRDLRSENESTTTAVRDNCPPGDAPGCPPGFTLFFPHPNDCHWYFQCSNGVAYCKECPADLQWNVQLETCDFPYSAGCNLST